ncbi:hypothetical protein [Naasia lichenicola]|uniref:Uncharacterized protein n=1 Tax=Naasia lichenicola TaxID=2565933 RepID=A0A4S4FNV6_9MICO|nr:hypothetical protein [Naasia lichenicola]THG30691.1 hypothetical protein E6C64_08605 [Naasia lichenicola]THG31928.1 hypothetical protein E6C64_07750 [Naasia lichenicola]
MTEKREEPYNPTHELKVYFRPGSKEQIAAAAVDIIKLSAKYGGFAHATYTLETVKMQMHFKMVELTKQYFCLHLPQGTPKAFEAELNELYGPWMFEFEANWDPEYDPVIDVPEGL